MKQLWLTIDTSMGSVGSPPHLGSSIDLYVLNHQRVYIQSLDTKTNMKVNLGRLLYWLLIKVESLNYRDAGLKISINWSLMPLKIGRTTRIPD